MQNLISSAQFTRYNLQPSIELHLERRTNFLLQSYFVLKCFVAFLMGVFRFLLVADIQYEGYK